MESYSGFDCPPSDPETRGIIDKLVEFVARNGLEFEVLTREKQRNNPKFSFLFGGSHSAYYRRKLEAATAAMKDSFVPPAMSNQPFGMNNIDALKRKVQESEENLKAQHVTILIRQDEQVKEAIRTGENEVINRMSVECGTNLTQLSKLLASLKENCSKDSVAHCKSWISKNSVNQKCEEVIVRFLLALIKDKRNTATFRLHLLYLVNDLLHSWLISMEEPVNQRTGLHSGDKGVRPLSFFGNYCKASLSAGDTFQGSPRISGNALVKCA